ncbi:protein CHUP1, chloroplastic isoform X2 [Cornus florida]|uniref:protein CHUP1, chloroplastic isoform X2 n=1 Tax=Cornus florida TaxID=4283 RepID=UPI0028A0874F|nr:protein CHUP1, chloroplastic isoform X2 [Cornus florida]
MHKEEDPAIHFSFPLPPVIIKQNRMAIPDHESRIAFLRRELEASLAMINSLEKENLELKQEVARLRVQVSALKAHDNERKSMLWKKLQYSMDSNITEKYLQKPAIQMEIPEKSPVVENLYPKEDLVEAAAKKESPARVPKPPPRPPPTTTVPAYVEEVNGNKVPPAPAPPPPPPPPPPPSKLLVRSKAVHRVPEVMDFYRSLMKRDSQRESKTNQMGLPSATNSRNMIGEIENRSAYLLAIKSDVETQGEFINFLTREVEGAAFTEISDVETFVKWLDGELSCLVDERAVLKHFPRWPERKADALREAAFNYRDLKNLQYEVSSFKDNPKQLLTQSLTKIQALQDRLERSVDNIERMREATSKRYREFHIPWKWMLDIGLIGQMKLSSLALAKEYMKRVTKELQYNESSQEEILLLQGVRFAYRVHQVVLMWTPRRHSKN